jgi:hypothetical protein
VATNLYITDFLTQVKGISGSQASLTLLVTFTTPTTAWIIIAVGLALGQWLMLALRRIPPGQKLEEIAT